MHMLLPLLLPLQLVHEFRLVLLLGRTLCHKQPGVSMTCTRLVQLMAASASARWTSCSLQQSGQCCGSCRRGGTGRWVPAGLPSSHAWSTMVHAALADDSAAMLGPQWAMLP
jgi:hypothetical protein